MTTRNTMTSLIYKEVSCSDKTQNDKALKVIRSIIPEPGKGKKSNNEEAYTMFRKHVAEIMSLLQKGNHCSIVQVFGCSEDIPNGRFCIEMELCSNGTLATAIIGHCFQPFDNELTRDWFAQLVLAIHYLHEVLRMVHRKIKPSNIFLARNCNCVKLGLPNFEIRTNTSLVFSHSMLPYMSLQQLEDQPPAFKDDIWSLGVILFQLVTLQLPFTSELEDVPKSRHSAMVASIKKGEWVCEPGPSVQSCVKELLRGMLTVSVEQRISLSGILLHEYMRGALVPYNPMYATEPRKDSFSNHCSNSDQPVLQPSQRQDPANLQRYPNNWLPRSKDQQLVDSAYWGDLAKVKQLLDEGQASIEGIDGSLFGIGSTSLILASEYGHLNIVRLLVERGANANARDNRGRTPLIAAAAGGHLKCVQVLVRKGHADVEQKNDLPNASPGGTALTFAVAMGHVDIVKFLIDEAKADIEARNANGSTPLIVASYYCQEAVVRALIQRGADLNAETKDGKTASAVVALFPLISGAAKNDKAKILRLLKERGIRY